MQLGQPRIWCTGKLNPSIIAQSQQDDLIKVMPNIFIISLLQPTLNIASPTSELTKFHVKRTLESGSMSQRDRWEIEFDMIIFHRSKERVDFDVLYFDKASHRYSKSFSWVNMCRNMLAVEPMPPSGAKCPMAEWDSRQNILHVGCDLPGLCIALEPILFWKDSGHTLLVRCFDLNPTPMTSLSCTLLG